ncbi:MAG: YtxH domain-containing protein [Bryobacteraceae bacterium]
MTDYSEGKCSIGSKASCFVLGLVAGGAVAMLMAPYSGKDARARLRAGAANGEAKVDAGAEFLKRRTEEFVAQAEDVFASVKNRVVG